MINAARTGGTAAARISSGACDRGAIQRVRALALVAAVTACVAGPASGTVIVSSTDPDRFTDAADGSTDARNVLTSLAGHLRELGDRYLRPGDELRILLVDVDRAGRPRLGPTETRMMRGDADFPCIELSFTLRANGGTAKDGLERVCDQRYLMSRRAAIKYSPNDPLAYEKVMLDDWFQIRFGTKRDAH